MRSSLSLILMGSLGFLLSCSDIKQAKKDSEFAGESENAKVSSSTTKVASTLSPLLIVQKSGPGAGVVSTLSKEIDCGTTCQARFPQGSRVELTAMSPDPKVAPVWTGCALVQAGKCQVLMNTPNTVRVNFEIFNLIDDFSERHTEFFAGVVSGPISQRSGNGNYKNVISGSRLIGIGDGPTSTLGQRIVFAPSPVISFESKGTGPGIFRISYNLNVNESFTGSTGLKLRQVTSGSGVTLSVTFKSSPGTAEQVSEIADVTPRAGTDLSIPFQEFEGIERVKMEHIIFLELVFTVPQNSTFSFNRIDRVAE